MPLTFEEAQRRIAETIHAYDHPEYDTCTYCAMCWATAEHWLTDLPPKEPTPGVGPSMPDLSPRAKPAHSKWEDVKARRRPSAEETMNPSNPRRQP